MVKKVTAKRGRKDFEAGASSGTPFPRTPKEEVEEPAARTSPRNRGKAPVEPKHEKTPDPPSPVQSTEIPSLTISEVTANVLNVDFGIVHNVVVATMIQRNFPPSFVVAATIESVLGHCYFAIADHWASGTVIVAFHQEGSDSTQEDIDDLVGRPFSWGGNTIHFWKVNFISRASPDPGRVFDAEPVVNDSSVF